MTTTGAETAPVSEPRKARLLPVPVRVTCSPEAATLSAVPAAAVGQLKLRPLALTVEPGVTPAVARAWAE